MCYILISLINPTVSSVGVIVSYGLGRGKWGETALFDNDSLPLMRRGKGNYTGPRAFIKTIINAAALLTQSKLRLNWACETNTFPKAGSIKA